MSTPGETKPLRAPSVSAASSEIATAPRLIFLALLSAFCLWVLHLPVFPMQDGPMHLYLASVLGELLAHSSTGSLYSQFYTVQHLLPPYSLHYYLLIVLMKIMPALWAEKTVVCIIVITFCSGVRALARANGPPGDIFGLFSLAIALNWPLMMGFQNYILSLGIACWALAWWCRRVPPGARAGARFVFVGCCWLASITHPLPLLLVLGFAFADLCLRAFASLLSGRKSLPDGFKADALALVCASTLLFYLRAFTDKHRSAQDLHVPASLLSRIHYFAGLHGLDFFRSNDVAGGLFQLALYAVLLVCIVFGAMNLQRAQLRESWQPASTWFLVTALLTVVMPFLPDDLSGSKALVSRLQVVTWIGLIAAASGRTNLRRRWATLLSVLAVATALGSLALGQVRLAPMARRIVAVDQGVTQAAGSKGLLLSARADDDASFADVTYEPLHWQAAAYFRQTHAALLNTPWMDSTWLPLAARPTLLTDSFDPWTMECYHCLRQQLVDSAAVRDRVLPQTDFILFVDQPGNATQADLDEVLKADPAYQWECKHHDWLWLCRKQGASVLPPPEPGNGQIR